MDGKLNSSNELLGMKAEITLHKNGSSYKAYLNKFAAEMIKSDRIFFDVRSLKLRLPDFDDDIIYKITRGNVRKYKDKTYVYDSRYAIFSFGGKKFDDDNLGRYFLEQENEWFVLTR